MQHTPVIVGAFVAAIIAGLLVRFMQKEHFSQKSVGMPIDFSQPALPYDGTSTLLGSEAKPISQKPYDMADDTQLFFLAKNKVGSDCCPSVYSTGGGCVCVSDAEAEVMGSRGGNRARGS